MLNKRKNTLLNLSSKFSISPTKKWSQYYISTKVNINIPYAFFLLCEPLNTEIWRLSNLLDILCRFHLFKIVCEIINEEPKMGRTKLLVQNTFFLDIRLYISVWGFDINTNKPVLQAQLIKHCQCSVHHNVLFVIIIFKFNIFQSQIYFSKFSLRFLDVVSDEVMSEVTKFYRKMVRLIFIVDIHDWLYTNFCL